MYKLDLGRQSEHCEVHYRKGSSTLHGMPLLYRQSIPRQKNRHPLGMPDPSHTAGDTNLGLQE